MEDNIRLILQKTKVVRECEIYIHLQEIVDSIWLECAHLGVRGGALAIQIGFLEKTFLLASHCLISVLCLSFKILNKLFVSVVEKMEFLSCNKKKSHYDCEFNIGSLKLVQNNIRVHYQPVLSSLPSSLLSFSLSVFLFFSLSLLYFKSSHEVGCC